MNTLSYFVRVISFGTSEIKFLDSDIIKEKLYVIFILIYKNYYQNFL